jgi:hypothetical protein
MEALMKAFVLIWLGGLAVIGLVSVLYPPSDTNVYPTTYETVVQPFAVPSQPVDVSVVQRVAVQANALAVAVKEVQGKNEAIASRLQSIEDRQTRLADADKALRVYVDERDKTLNGALTKAHRSSTVLGWCAWSLGALALLFSAGALRKVHGRAKEGQK